MAKTVQTYPGLQFLSLEIWIIIMWQLGLTHASCVFVFSLNMLFRNFPTLKIILGAYENQSKNNQVSSYTGAWQSRCEPLSPNAWILTSALILTSFGTSSKLLGSLPWSCLCRWIITPPTRVENYKLTCVKGNRACHTVSLTLLRLKLFVTAVNVCCHSHLSSLINSMPSAFVLETTVEYSWLVGCWTLNLDLHPDFTI